MSPSASPNELPAPAAEREPPRSRWKTSARIEQLNQQAAAHEHAQRLASRRWATLNADRVPEMSLGRDEVHQLQNLGDPRAVKPLTGWVGDNRAPAWLVSLIVHMIIVLLLAFLTYAQYRGSDGEVIRMQMPDASQTEPALQQVPVVTSAPDVVSNNPAAQSGDSTLDQDQPLDAANAAVVEPQANPLTPQPSGSLLAAGAPETSSNLLRRFSGGKLGDRSPASRTAAVTAGQTTADAERALEEALRWLAAHQHNDGGWSFRLADKNGPCGGQCENLRENPDDAPIPRTAATGLAMLAFMGAGSTHQQGPYAEEVRRGLYYLRSQASSTSMGSDLQNGSMYGHGIATLAIAEAYVLTGDPDLEEFAETTTFFCSSARHPSGGWGYLPGGPPDITLSAWQIIALKTAEQRGILIPTEVIPDAKAYVATLASDGMTRFGYKTPEPKWSTTAIGLLLQLYFGFLPGQTEMRIGLSGLVDHGPSESDVYYNYYAMLALHHAQHAGRMDFARRLQDYLVATQAREGHERGSWNFPDRYGSVGGRLYTTALCALILETPYRYVPMHDPSAPFEL